MGRAGEKRLVALASKQLCVVTSRDLAAFQISRNWLRRRLESGEWIRLYRGVFKLGPGKPSVDELEMAALLDFGDGAVLSHTSAARRLGLDVPQDSSVQVTIPAWRHIRGHNGVRVWRSRNLVEKDITKRGPFRLTHLARTMIDLASVLEDGWLRATLDSALRQKMTNLAWIVRGLNEHGNGRLGARRLRALLSEYDHCGEVPDSVLESLAFEVARATGHMPKLHWNIRDGARRIAEVDLAWPEVQLCVELDGWVYHGTRAAFVGDRARDRALLRLGWMVLRYTWDDVHGDRESMIAELSAAYDSRALSIRSHAGDRRAGTFPQRPNGRQR